MDMTEVKTINDWNHFADENKKAGNGGQYSWYDYAKPGDLVDESVFEHFMDVVPPRTLTDGYLQVGEPYSMAMNEQTGRMENTYLTIERVSTGLYRYCGNCFKNRTEHMG